MRRRDLGAIGPEVASNAVSMASLGTDFWPERRQAFSVTIAYFRIFAVSAMMLLISASVN